MSKSSRMAPKEKQTIEIEKTHIDPLLSFNQAVTVDCSDFLGTALNVPYSFHCDCKHHVWHECDSRAGFHVQRYPPEKTAFRQLGSLAWSIQLHVWSLVKST